MTIMTYFYMPCLQVSKLRVALPRTSAFLIQTWVDTGVGVRGWTVEQTLSMDIGGGSGRVDSIHGDWGGSGRVDSAHGDWG